MKKIITITLSVIYLTTNGQNELDALRFSQDLGLFGSARSAAIGNAFGALGGDFSSLSNNPAGIGLYQFNEFTFTPAFGLNSTVSYATNRIEGNNRNINIGNLGIVYSLNKKSSDWKRINIGIGWNQLASYDKNIWIYSENSNSSLADRILDEAQGNSIDELDQLYAGPAFWSDLIDLADNSIDTTLDVPWYLFDNGNYISHIKSDSKKLQEKHLISNGGKGEFVFSFGGSYNERIYLGATVSTPNIDYYEKSIYTENMLEDTINNLESFNWEEELSVYGEGVNLKLGMIMRLSDQIKIGTSLHSPTVFTIEETYSTKWTTKFNDGRNQEVSPYNYHQYELITPWKASISASTTYKKMLLISGQYEIIDYAFTEMSSNSHDFRVENTAIKDLYKRSNNIMIGAEVNIKPLIIRSGYAQYGSPYINNDFSRENYSFGIGINNGNFFFDAAYVLSQGNNSHRLYSEDYVEPISLKETEHNLIFTLGLRY